MTINNDFKDIVFGRKSIKIYDENVKISNEEILKMIDEAATAPSSFNFQPWRFVVVNTPEGKEKLKPMVNFNLRQNETSAAMLVIFGDKKCQNYGEEIYQEAVDKGYMSQDVKDKILPGFVELYDKLSDELMTNVVKVDASLFAMQFMLIARAYGYDTNAIGGFNHSEIAETLNMDKERYVPVMIISIGKAAAEARETVRLAAEKITKFI
ncbi:nitroreductase family protein [Gemella sp. zg-1178]|uniref:nitroreductase family protein n=1 Tax=Gemella sp. zg-1178 TaxID=2840372 RepID=UPI001C04DC23|nr:nitroreductase family protein [Gemella sp. zg-1178]MBU0278079.1 nitroreductase family protein [Gemella sp. zg-1178]